MFSLPPEKVKKCLSRMSGKLSRTVLRRGKGSNPFSLVDYTSKVFQEKLKKQEMMQSMSRVGHCIDNGPTEGFWGIIKTEMYQMYDIFNESSLKHAINDYILFYSTERPQDRYNCKTPLEVRNDALQSGQALPYPIVKNKRIEKYKEKWCA